MDAFGCFGVFGILGGFLGLGDVRIFGVRVWQWPVFRFEQFRVRGVWGFGLRCLVFLFSIVTHYVYVHTHTYIYIYTRIYIYIYICFFFWRGGRGGGGREVSGQPPCLLGLGFRVRFEFRQFEPNT